MSGGSFGYLYAAELPERASDLRLMVEELHKRGAAMAADETEALLREPTDELRDLWRAIEWRVSGDIGDDELAEAMATYVRRHGERLLEEWRRSRAALDEAVSRYGIKRRG